VSHCPLELVLKETVLLNMVDMLRLVYPCFELQNISATSVSVVWLGLFSLCFLMEIIYFVLMCLTMLSVPQSVYS
jgi:hypothetical protein